LLFVVEDADGFRQDALLAAVTNGHTSTVELLLRGCDEWHVSPSGYDDTKLSPLMIAFRDDR
jgi:hypothetical protein